MGIRIQAQREGLVFDRRRNIVNSMWEVKEGGFRHR